jgi:hypothetical protein
VNSIGLDSLKMLRRFSLRPKWHRMQHARSCGSNVGLLDRVLPRRIACPTEPDRRLPRSILDPAPLILPRQRKIRPSRRHRATNLGCVRGYDPDVCKVVAFFQGGNRVDVEDDAGDGSANFADTFAEIVRDIAELHAFLYIGTALD